MTSDTVKMISCYSKLVEERIWNQMHVSDLLKIKYLETKRTRT